MARGRRRRPKTDVGGDPAEGERRPRRRILPLAVGLSAVPVGLIVAASLVAASGSGTDTAAGEIGEGMTNETVVPDAASDEGFFDDPTGAPDDSSPAGDSDPQDAQVTASSSPDEDDPDDDSGSGGGGSGGGSGGGNGGSGGSGGGSGGGGGNGASSSPMADEVVSLVNSERAQNGCDPVSVDGRLTSAAQEHSEDMDQRDYMDHHSPDGEGPGERAERHGYDAWGAENVAKGQQSAEQVMDSWMDSPGHRENILNCDLEAIGVGEAGHAWTQKFGYE